MIHVVRNPQGQRPLHVTKPKLFSKQMSRCKTMSNMRNLKQYSHYQWAQASPTASLSKLHEEHAYPSDTPKPPHTATRSRAPPPALHSFHLTGPCRPWNLGQPCDIPGLCSPSGAAILGINRRTRTAWQRGAASVLIRGMQCNIHTRSRASWV